MNNKDLETEILEGLKPHIDYLLSIEGVKKHKIEKPVPRGGSNKEVRLELNSYNAQGEIIKVFGYNGAQRQEISFICPSRSLENVYAYLFFNH